VHNTENNAGGIFMGNIFNYMPNNYARSDSTDKNGKLLAITQLTTQLPKS